MLTHKLLGIVVATASVGGLTYAGLATVADLDAESLLYLNRTLDVRAQQLAGAFDHLGDPLPAAARVLTANPDFASDARLLGFARSNIRPGAQPTTFQQSRIDTYTQRVDEVVATFRTEHSDISGVALVGEDGDVLVSDSPLFRQGNNVLTASDAGESDDVEDPSDEGAAEAEDKDDVETDADTKGDAEIDAENGDESEDSMAFVADVLEGRPATVIQVLDDGIAYIGAVPLRRAGRVIGLVAVVRSVTAMPEGLGPDTVLLKATHVQDAPVEAVLGEPPVGYGTREVAVDGSLLIPVPAAATAFGSDWEFSGMFMDGRGPATMIREVDIDGIDGVRGVVYATTDSLYANLYGTQLALMVFGIIACLVLWVLVVLSGRRVARGITSLSDFMGRVHQGGAHPRAIDERKLPSELRRLARLVNKTVVDSGTPGGAVSPLPSAPSVDDVLDATAAMGDVAAAPSEVDEVVESDDSGSQGFGSLDAALSTNDVITEQGPALQRDADSASVPASSLAADIASEVTDDDGYDNSVASAGAGLLFDEEPGSDDAELPDVDEAANAVDHLDDGSDGAPTPADSGARDGNKSGPGIMSMPPEMLAAMGKPPAGSDANGGEVSVAEDDGRATPPPPPPEDQFGGEDDVQATTVMEVPEELLAKMGKATPAPAESSPMTSPFGSPDEEATPEPEPANEPAPAAKAAAANEPAAGPNGADGHFREVFDSFVETRKECGEAGELSFPKFSKRLELSKAAVIQKHGCGDVRFQVYVKNGKAALKATPAA